MGLVVLGVPCNQFGAQEPGNAEAIRTFCQSRHGVSFPMTAKIKVNGPGQHPLYAWLSGRDATFPGRTQWNFEKFLVGADGRVPARFEPTVFLYDNHPGGSGLAAPLYRARDGLLADATLLVHDCACARGCPACIGPVLEHDEQRGRDAKRAALQVLALLADGTGPRAPTVAPGR